jgi:hypothetical protein
MGAAFTRPFLHQQAMSTALIPAPSREEEDRLKMSFLQQFLAPAAALVRKKKHHNRKATDRPTRGQPDWSKGYECDALSVHPDQAAEFQQLTKQLGLSGIQYDQRGRCTVTSREHRKIWMRERGLRDNDGGYGD